MGFFENVGIYKQYNPIENDETRIYYDVGDVIKYNGISFQCIISQSSWDVYKCEGCVFDYKGDIFSMHEGDFLRLCPACTSCIRGDHNVVKFIKI